MKTTLHTLIFRTLLVAVLLVTTSLHIKAYNLTIANGNDTCNRVPLCGNNYNTDGNYVHIIYDENLLVDMRERVITSITFYATDSIAFSGGHQKVSMKIVDQNSILGEVTEGVKTVFDGTIEPQGDSIKLEFKDPFVYNNGNLLVSFEWDGEGTCADTYFYGKDSDIGYAFPCVEVCPAMTPINFLPKTTFGYEFGGSGVAYSINKEFGVVPYTMLPITKKTYIYNHGVMPLKFRFYFDENYNCDAFTIPIDSAIIYRNESLEIPVTFVADPNIRDTTYTSRLVIVQVTEGHDNHYNPVIFTGTVSSEPVQYYDYSLIRADGYGYGMANSIPIDFNYWNVPGAHTQTIYHKDEIECMVGKEIVSISYDAFNSFNSLDGDGEAIISLASSNLDYYYNNTFVDDLTQVGTWSPPLNGRTFEVGLTTPYKYDGDGNLIIDWKVTTPGNSTCDVWFDGWITTPNYYENEYTYSIIQNDENAPLYGCFVPSTTFRFRDAIPVIKTTPEFGTYIEPQNIVVDVENMPENATLVYMFVGTDNTPLLAESTQEWIAYNNDTGINVDRSGVLTIAVRAANGTDYTSVEGQYIIDVNTDINITNISKEVVKVRFYNQLGISSNEPFHGVNIKVTTYSDGTHTTEKVIK